MISGAVFAQTAEEGKEKRKHSIYKGSKAIQFGIASNLTLKKFQEMAFSGKKHISDKSAVRIGIDLNFLISDVDKDVFSIRHDTTTSQVEETYNNDEIDLWVQFMRYSSINNSIKFYWAGGPIFGFERWFYKKRDDTPQLSGRSQETLIWLVGTSWTVGAEWFATPELGLHAEYYLSLTFNWRRTNDTSYSSNTISYGRDRNYSFNLSSGDVRFGLSTYF
jgi:hypothetical protein